MSIFTKKDGKKLILRSAYIKLLVFLGLIGLSLITLRPIQALLNRVMVQIRSEIIGKVEDVTGLDVYYSSIRPAFLGSFDIRDLRFMKEEDALFSVSGIKLNFSIREILVSKKAIIHTVLVEKPVLSIDTLRDKDTFDKISTWFKEQEKDSQDERDLIQQIANFLPKDVDYQIHNGSFYLVDGETTYQIEDINFNLKGKDNKFHIDGYFAAEFTNLDVLDRNLTIKTNVGLNGVFSDDLQEGSSDISFAYITCDEDTQVLFTVLPIKFSVNYKDKTIFASEKIENTSLEYSFYYEIENGNIDAELYFDDFQMSEIIMLSSKINYAEYLLYTRLIGSASLSYNNENELNYSLNLLGRNTSAAVSASFIDSILINAYGNEKYLFINDLLVSTSENALRNGFFQGTARFSGNIEFSPFKPSGTLLINNFSLTGNDHLSAVFNVSSRNNMIQVSSRRVAIAQTQINNLDVFIYPYGRDISISLSGYSMDSGYMFIDAIYNNNPDQLVVSMTLDSLSVYEITEYIRPFTDFIPIPAIGQEYARKCLINTDIFMSTNFTNIMYNAPNLVLNMGETQGILSLSGTDRQFTLSNGLFNLDDNELAVSANINYSNPQDLYFSLNANYLEFSWNITGQLIDSSILVINDPNGLNIYGNMSDTGAVSGYIEAIDFPIPVNAQPVYLSFYSTINYNALDSWDINLNHFLVRNVNSQDGMESLRISGAANQDGASFREIIYNDTRGFLTGSADFSWDTDFSYIAFAANITDGRERGEFYHLEGVYRNENITVNASISEMNFDRFIKNSIPMLVSADISASWSSIDSFNAKINLSSFYTRIQNSDIHGAFIINMTNENVLVENLWLNIDGLRAVIPEFLVNREEGILKARADVSGYTMNRNFNTNINLDFSFDRVNSWRDIQRAAYNFDGKVIMKDVQYGAFNQDEMIFALSGNEGAISVNGGIRNMIRLEMDPEGNFFAGLSAPMPIRGTIIGTYNDGIIDAYCNNFFIDLESIWSLVSVGEDFSIKGGYITGQIDMRGPFWNPEFYGTAIGSSLRMSVPGYISEDIRAVPFNVLAEGYEMTFGPADTLCGTGGGTVNGWFLFQNWSPSTVGLDISIPRDSPIPFDVNINGFLANGNASGSLNLLFDGINSFMEIKGNLFTNDADLGLNMDEMMSISEEEPVDIDFRSIVDLSITAGSMVEFIWPTNSPIIRANPEMGTVFYVTLDTQTGQYSINSDIRVRSGELYYFDRNFFIRQGHIVFKENESSFDPYFSARAETRDRTDTGPVTIHLIVENQPLFGFEPRFEASPSLTQLEIYSILGQNFTTTQGEDNSEMVQRMLTTTTDLVTQFIATSDILSQFVFFRQLERQVRDFIGLDIFSVRTRLLHNVFATGASAFGGQGPVDRFSSVGNYIDNTTVFMGKYIGQHMFLHGMLTMRYDESSSALGNLRLRIEPDFGIELQSPFFNIRWDFFPFNPENWFVIDNSITLSWSKSF